MDVYGIVLTTKKSQSSSNLLGISTLNHPAVGVPPWPWSRASRAARRTMHLGPQTAALVEVQVAEAKSVDLAAKERERCRFVWEKMGKYGKRLGKDWNIQENIGKYEANMVKIWEKIGKYRKIQEDMGKKWKKIGKYRELWGKCWENSLEKWSFDVEISEIVVSDNKW